VNAYELIRPDGTGTGVWGCGECHRVHLKATIGIRPDTVYNKVCAEDCCSPHNCRYCGRPTERTESTGQWPHFHKECIPQEVPELLHPSMNDPFARLLYAKMSWICEEGWAAGWLVGHEYVLWNCLQNKFRNFARYTLTDNDFEELNTLVTLAGGWIWTGEEPEHLPRLVSLKEWDEILEKRYRT